ncbi:MAG: DNA primase [Burkholderiaceae bacterium]
MAIPQSFIQELVARADVVEIVGRYVQLKKTGANFSGLCPFHAEKSPSFTVSPTKQFYHCFGCGKNGNAIGFLMDHTGMGFIDAVKELAGQYGMQVPEEDVSPEQRARANEQRQKQTTLTEVLEKAGDSYRKHLKDSPRAVDYCKRRGLSGDIARRFGLGYAPQGWRSLASVFPHYDDPLLVESGLVIQSQDADSGNEEKRYDRFRDRLMFPIRNVKGECIGFGGRVLGDEKPKYLNSPETPVFHKGRELYGLFEARMALREQGFVLVTEGYMDVVALAQLGFPNAVATLGTACTADHVQKLFRFTDAVVFSFDGDNAGRRAARKALDAALPHASDVRNVKFLFLPAEHDPDSFIRANGHDAFSGCIRDAVPLSRFLLDAAREGCDLLSAEGRALMASNARPLWTQLPDGALKRQLLAEIATLVQLPARELTELWTPAAPAPAQEQREPPHRQADGEPGRANTRWSRPPPPSRRTGRVLPASRADHAARILLGHMAAWELFSAEDHAMLCELPAPHGPLFVWLEHELHERGPQPWGAIREGLRDHASEQLALRVMADPQLASVENESATLDELRNLVTRIHIEVIEALKDEASAAVTQDPSALQRFQELHARWLALKAGLG